MPFSTLPFNSWIPFKGRAVTFLGSPSVSPAFLFEAGARRLSITHTVRVHRRTALHGMVSRFRSAGRQGLREDRPRAEAGGPGRFRLGPGRKPTFYETSSPRGDALGNVRSDSVKRVASAVGEGSVVVQFIHCALEE